MDEASNYLALSARREAAPRRLCPMEYYKALRRKTFQREDTVN